MAVFVLILGLLQLAGGVVVWLAAKSAMHEIVGASLFGFGSVCFALAVIIGKFDDAAAEARKRSAS